MSTAVVSNSPAQTAQRKRIPMSGPQLALSVPDIPGYRLYWFRGDPGRIQRAEQGGYEFVRPEEVALNNRTLGSDPAKAGNTDMGSRVSAVAGAEVGLDQQPVRLYLMKIKEEYWREDQAAQLGPGSRLNDVRKALAGGLLGAEGQALEDRKQVYVDPKRTKIPDFLIPK